MLAGSIPVLLETISINKTVNGVLYLHSHFLKNCQSSVVLNEPGLKQVLSETQTSMV